MRLRLGLMPVAALTLERLQGAQLCVQASSRLTRLHDFRLSYRRGPNCVYLSVFVQIRNDCTYVKHKKHFEGGRDCGDLRNRYGWYDVAHLGGSGGKKEVFTR